MSLNSRQRAYLRGISNDMSADIQIGKDVPDDAVIKNFENYLSKRELVKVNVLKTSEITPREAAELVAEKIGGEVVQVIGRRFIIYKFNQELAKKGEGIVLP